MAAADGAVAGAGASPGAGGRGAPSVVKRGGRGVVLASVGGSGGGIVSTASRGPGAASGCEGAGRGAASLPGAGGGAGAPGGEAGGGHHLLRGGGGLRGPEGTARGRAGATSHLDTRRVVAVDRACAVALGPAGRRPLAAAHAAAG